MGLFWAEDRLGSKGHQQGQDRRNHQGPAQTDGIAQEAQDWWADQEAEIGDAETMATPSDGAN